MNQTDQRFQPLFTPWKIGNVEIKNRIVLCPMGGTSWFGWMEHTGNHFDKEAAKLFIQITAGMGRSWAIPTPPVIDCPGDEFLQYVKDDMTVTVAEDGTVTVA